MVKVKALVMSAFSFAARIDHSSVAVLTSIAAVQELTNFSSPTLKLLLDLYSNYGIMVV